MLVRSPPTLGFETADPAATVAAVPASAPEGDGRTSGEDAARPVERAYQGIRHAILTGDLRPGEHLVEQQLAALTGTSRTPVREALRRLVGEGLATARNRHRFVTVFSEEEAAVVFDLRATLEGYAAGLAAARIEEHELAHLAALTEAIDALDEDAGDAAVRRYAELNDAFHTAIIEATRSHQVRLLAAQAIAIPLVVLKRFVCDQRIDIARSNAQHRDIVAALAQRNADWARAAMAGHILATKPRP